MNEHIVFGLFAFYVAAISLYLVLSGRHDALLALLRLYWGRSVGHSLYFIARVALPMLVFVLCLGWGVRHYDASVVYLDFDSPLKLNVDYYRNPGLQIQGEPSQDSAEIVFGA